MKVTIGMWVTKDTAQQVYMRALDFKISRTALVQRYIIQQIYELKKNVIEDEWLKRLYEERIYTVVDENIDNMIIESMESLMPRKLRKSAFCGALVERAVQRRPE